MKNVFWITLLIIQQLFFANRLMAQSVNESVKSIPQKGYWNTNLKIVKVADKYKLNTNWYAKLKQAISVRDKYHNGYWLQYYIFKDLQNLFIRTNDKKMLQNISAAYFSSDWNFILSKKKQNN